MADAQSVLVVIDMQNDFITGSLGTPEAQAILDGVVEKVEGFPGRVLYTLDTHGDDYLETQEGRNLPVEHCLCGTDGWQVPRKLADALARKNARAYEKPTFGSVELARDLAALDSESPISSIEFVGVCTDICVVSNALLAKASLPETPVSVDARLCAGVTPEAHEAALATLASCQVAVER